MDVCLVCLNKNLKHCLIAKVIKKQRKVAKNMYFYKQLI